jgi:hypothetical protein
MDGQRFFIWTVTSTATTNVSFTGKQMKHEGLKLELNRFSCSWYLSTDFWLRIIVTGCIILFYKKPSMITKFLLVLLCLSFAIMSVTVYVNKLEAIAFFSPEYLPLHFSSPKTYNCSIFQILPESTAANKRRRGAYLQNVLCSSASQRGKLRHRSHRRSHLLQTQANQKHRTERQLRE